MKHNFLRRALAKPDEHPFVFVFVLTLALGVAAEGLSTLILNDLGEWLHSHIGLDQTLWQLLVVVVLVGIVLLVISNIVQRLRKFRGFIFDIPELETYVKPLEEAFPGLIATASLKKDENIEIPAEFAIKHHWRKGKLRYCWLICSEDVFFKKNQEGRTTDELLIQSLKKAGVPLQVFSLLHGDSNPKLDQDTQTRPYLRLYLIKVKPSQKQGSSLADDPNYIRQLVDWIYSDVNGIAHVGLDETEVIADYTGGTKSMTAGVVLACTSPSRRLQYIWSEYDGGKIVPSGVREVIISYKLKPVKPTIK